MQALIKLIIGSFPAKAAGISNPTLSIQGGYRPICL